MNVYVIGRPHTPDLICPPPPLLCVTEEVQQKTIILGRWDVALVITKQPLGYTRRFSDGDANTDAPSHSAFSSYTAAETLSLLIYIYIYIYIYRFIYIHISIPVIVSGSRWRLCAVSTPGLNPSHHPLVSPVSQCYEYEHMDIMTGLYAMNHYFTVKFELTMNFYRI